MIRIIHGDNQAASREYLNEQKDLLNSKGLEQISINGEKVSYNEIEEALLTSNLFTKDYLFIENLLSRTKSKEKEKILDLLASYKGDKPIILWEKKTATKTKYKKLKSLKPTVKEFKLPMEIFKFISAISPSSKDKSLELLHDALKNSSETFIFIMLSKQISKLITAKSAPSSLKGAPWQKAQVLKQANTWELDLLKSTHTSLLEIDYAIKSGNSSLSLSDHLDLIILEL